MKNYFELMLAFILATGLLLVCVLIISAVLAALTSNLPPQDRTERNEWGQQGPPGCETILQWTEACD